MLFIGLPPTRRLRLIHGLTIPPMPPRDGWRLNTNSPMRLDDYAPRPAHLKWLRDSDTPIRWQVMRDLTDEAPDAIRAERSRVATEGWGAELLARQSPRGRWG